MTNQQAEIVKLQEWAAKNPQEAIKRAAKVREALLVQAREDINTFAEMVFKDEFTGNFVVQSNLHEDWHRQAAASDRLCLFAPIEHGKTNNMAIIRTVWELGRNPNLRFIIISNTAKQAKKIIAPIQRYIEQSEELHAIFPDLLPSDREADKWSSDQLTVRRSSSAKDPSVMAIGIHGALLGARADRLIMDDILDFENCRTQQQREDLWLWIRSAVFGRLTEHARVLVVGTAFHPEDVLHKLAKEPGWVHRRTPAIDAEGNPRWPERWSKERIEKKKIELGPMEFARQMLCVARDDASSRFEQRWIDKSFELGKDRMFRARFTAPSGILVVIGVDLAVQQHSAADETVIFVVAVHQNQTREVLKIEAGKWTGPDIVERIYSAFSRYGAHKVIVESNSAQAFIGQFAASKYAMPIVPFTTTAQNKMHPQYGVESIAIEMSQGKWIFPCEGGKDKEMLALEAEMLYYQPTAHTGDRLMAMFFAREGARAGLPPTAETGSINLTRR